MGATDRLKEISEADARGETSRIYSEIRTAMAVPVVALFYRNLAAIDGALPWMWTIVEPFAKSGQLVAAATRTAAAGDAAPLVAVLRSPSPQPIKDVLDAYNRANPFNVVCAALLDAVLTGHEPDSAIPLRSGAPALPSAPARLPALVPVKNIDPDLQAAVVRLETVDTAGDGIVPSLYRHLAHWPDFLRAAADALSPCFASGDVLNAARAIAQHSRAEAGVLMSLATIPPMPPALQQTRDGIIESADKFSRRIPEMIVVGRLLANALNEGNTR